eukprot:scaffold4026_cov117-Cylindrotheca_fusiformis.AAC.7
MSFGLDKLIFCLSIAHTLSFAIQPKPFSHGRCLFSTAQDEGVVKLSLEKPLGIVLEEVEEGEPQGVFVVEVAEEGAAAPHEEEIVGLKIATVMGEDVTTLYFDDVMEKLIKAPSPVSVEFTKQQNENESGFPVGTEVAIQVLDGGKETILQAKVGDNLRQFLLENDIEVYKGVKQKLGNCGGAGQCTFCAAEFVAEEGWAPRSDYENTKLKNKPNSRLTCLNNIQGPATIKL